LLNVLDSSKEILNPRDYPTMRRALFWHFYTRAIYDRGIVALADEPMSSGSQKMVEGPSVMGIYSKWLRGPVLWGYIKMVEGPSVMGIYRKWLRGPGLWEYIKMVEEPSVMGICSKWLRGPVLWGYILKIYD
jgi:hypothetical protein